MQWHLPLPLLMKLLLLAVALLMVLAWTRQDPPTARPASLQLIAAKPHPSHAGKGAASSAESQESHYAARRQVMVEEQLRAPLDRRRPISDPRVLEAMGRVPRHRFVPQDLRDHAYADGPLPIGAGQTISQPYIVALMTQVVQTRTDARALDVGTGSGYQAAILAELVQDVYSIEIIPSLAQEARARLATLHYENVEVKAGDGYRGWPEHAPFDVIIVAAAPDEIPQPLIDQLAPGGRLVIPVGSGAQKLVLVEKMSDGEIRRTTVTGVRFVPMTGEAQRH
jgi:protein-L-isoaspartate(D-aspartate) O-methyltransferase